MVWYNDARRHRTVVVRRVDGTEKILHSTRKEDGGTGVPHAFVLGKYTKEVFGLELGLRQIQPGERCIFKILADYAYEHPKSRLVHRSGPRCRFSTVRLSSFPICWPTLPRTVYTIRL